MYIYIIVFIGLMIPMARVPVYVRMLTYTDYIHFRCHTYIHFISHAPKSQRTASSS